MSSRCADEHRGLDRDLSNDRVAAFISGGAQGVDRMAERYVRQLHCPWTDNGRWIVSRELGTSPSMALNPYARGFMLVVLPDYQTYGRKAPLERNNIIARCCTRLIAFVNGRMTSGTGHVTGEASRLKMLVTVHTWRG
jgi:hypothetical protein